MPLRLSFLCLSDPRGDLDLVARALDLAHRSDVRAHGVFFLGNFAGPLLESADRASIQSARTALGQELESHRSVYRGYGIETAWDLAAYILINPQTFHRAAEMDAARVYRRLLGIRDKSGRFTDYGVATHAARNLYGLAQKLFSNSHAPCSVMADTCVAEEAIAENHWLHFGSFSILGFNLAGLGITELSDEDAIPEYAPGARRGGKVVKLEEHPIDRADVVFGYEANPAIDEFLASTRRKLVVHGGPGEIRADHRENTVATQRPGVAYLYTLHGWSVDRRAYAYEDGEFRLAAVQAEDEPATASGIMRRDNRRAEFQTNVKLAGVGKDLLVFLDLVRKQDPALAAKLEQATNRAEAIFQYVRHLEEERQRLAHGFSAERAGLERMLSRITPYFTEAQRSRLSAALARRPDASAEVEEIDAANGAFAGILEEILAERFGSIPAPEPP